MSATVSRPARWGDPVPLRVGESGNRKPVRHRGTHGAFLWHVGLIRPLVVPLQACDAADRDLADEHLPLPLTGVDALPPDAFHGRHGVETSERSTVDCVPIPVEAGEVACEPEIGAQRWRAAAKGAYRVRATDSEEKRDS